MGASILSVCLIGRWKIFKAIAFIRVNLMKKRGEPLTQIRLKYRKLKISYVRVNTFRSTYFFCQKEDAEGKFEPPSFGCVTASKPVALNSSTLTKIYGFIIYDFFTIQTRVRSFSYWKQTTGQFDVKFCNQLAFNRHAAVVKSHRFHVVILFSLFFFSILQIIILDKIIGASTSFSFYTFSSSSQDFSAVSAHALVLLNCATFYFWASVTRISIR